MNTDSGGTATILHVFQGLCDKENVLCIKMESTSFIKVLIQAEKHGVIPEGLFLTCVQINTKTFLSSFEDRLLCLQN